MSRSPGARSVINRAASLRMSLAMLGATVHSRSACCLIASTMRGCWWPMLTLTSWQEKSRYVLPLSSHIRDPWAPTITAGSSAPWADHEWNTCARSLAYAVATYRSTSVLILSSTWVMSCSSASASEGAPASERPAAAQAAGVVAGERIGSSYRDRKPRAAVRLYGLSRPHYHRLPMANTVRAALLQTDWTGDKESMIDKHEEVAREASAQGAQVICFQELFYGPYFCQVQEAQYYAYTEQIPDGPTTQRLQSVAKELGMVMVLPMYEIVQDGLYYNTAAVIDADGTYLGKYRKQHIPQVKGFWEKFYFAPGTGGYPIFDTAVGKVGVYICYDRHFPEGWRAIGLNGAQIVFNPSATHRGLSEYIWRLEQPAAAVANMYYVGAINRVGIEPLGENDFYGQSYFVDPRGQFVGDVGDAYKPELVVRDLDLDKIREVRDGWQFYRDRRPDAYDELVAR